MSGLCLGDQAAKWVMSHPKTIAIAALKP